MWDKTQKSSLFLGSSFAVLLVCPCCHRRKAAATAFVSENYLIDLVHNSEGAAIELLQGHEVEHRGDAALSSALVVRRELVELSAAVELHPNSDPILVILLLQRKTAFSRKTFFF